MKKRSGPKKNSVLILTALISDCEEINAKELVVPCSNDGLTNASGYCTKCPDQIVVSELSRFVGG
ncbi:hypothetical protein PC118_g19460 [Phytophthora cactorum]|uniref:Uncharacterized protein n=1 Tax=Phytophthora cactorum TaxID=29920 RepID=A0A8T1F5K4_9STRA|nr:hypothetical protein PC118_g19460 [Phytophthora cactorum]